MRRREFVIALGIAGLLWPVGLQAQEAGRTYRIGFLSAGPRSAPYWLEVFDDLQQAGFVEGQNLTVDWHQYGSHVDLISQFAAEVVKAKVDVIVATGDTAIRAVQQATTTIPILGSTDDMIGSGLVNSLARPDGNTTGTSIFAAGLDGKRQELLIEAVPGIRHMAALVDSKTTASSRLLSLQQAARSHGVELSVQPVIKSEEIPAALGGCRSNKRFILARSLWGSTVDYSTGRRMRLPAIYQFPDVAEEGGFLGYGPRVTQMYKELVGPMLVKLLRGTKPIDLPIEQPTKFELVVNLKTANALALEVPESFLARADKVIE